MRIGRRWLRSAFECDFCSPSRSPRTRFCAFQTALAGSLTFRGLSWVSPDTSLGAPVGHQHDHRHHHQHNHHHHHHHQHHHHSPRLLLFLLSLILLSSVFLSFFCLPPLSLFLSLSLSLLPSSLGLSCLISSSLPSSSRAHHPSFCCLLFCSLLVRSLCCSSRLASFSLFRRGEFLYW